MKKFENFKRHLATLTRSKEQDLENDFILSGIIGKFSIQFELGWKVMQELLRREGAGSSGSPREILKAAYRYFGFIDEDVWLSMLKDRNDMAHIYDGRAAKALTERIINEYIPAFQRLQTEVEKRDAAGSLE